MNGIRHAASVLMRTPRGYPLVKSKKKPSPHYWKLPGGRKESGESPAFTAIRELFEETGLRAEALHLVYDESRGDHDYLLFSGEIKSVEGLKDSGDDGEEICFVQTIREMIELPDLHPEQKILLQALAESGRLKRFGVAA